MKYLEFKIAEKKLKTNVYNIISENTGHILGKVLWHGAWRQYVFEPKGNTIWSRGCQREIIDFIDKIMSERNK